VLLAQLRTAQLDGDVDLVGGPLTIHALVELDALDRPEVLLLPILVGEGVPFSPPGTVQLPLQLESERRLADGTLELVYSPGREATLP
jgi:dihydrofolate reductase